MTWTNWSGRLTSTPQRIAPVSTAAQISELVRKAAGEGQGVRVQGAAHSHAPLVLTDGLLIDTDELDEFDERGIRSFKASAPCAGASMTHLHCPSSIRQGSERMRRRSVRA